MHLMLYPNELYLTVTMYRKKNIIQVSIIELVPSAFAVKVARVCSCA